MPHTPGPWTTKGPRGQGFNRTYGISHLSPGHDGGEIAEVETLHSTPEAHATQDANARLIAAAPDLLEALQAILDVADSYFDQDEILNADILETLHDAKSAIAKATGTET